MGKLVRDRIPDIIRSNGEMPKTRILDVKEYRSELLKKLGEEAAELKGAQAGDSFIGELADIEEVLLAIYDTFEIDKDTVESYRKQKRTDRGGFQDRIFLEGVSQQQ